MPITSFPVEDVVFVSFPKLEILSTHKFLMPIFFIKEKTKILRITEMEIRLERQNTRG